jgi:hypothetical protein
MGSRGESPGGDATRFRPVLLAAIAVLYALSIPWYRETGSVPGSFMGLPDWVAVALGCYIGVAVLNSIAWLLTDIPEAEVAPGEPGEDEP